MPNSNLSDLEERKEKVRGCCPSGSLNSKFLHQIKFLEAMFGPGIIMDAFQGKDPYLTLGNEKSSTQKYRYGIDINLGTTKDGNPYRSSKNPWCFYQFRVFQVGFWRYTCCMMNCQVAMNWPFLLDCEFSGEGKKGGVVFNDLLEQKHGQLRSTSATVDCQANSWQA